MKKVILSALVLVASLHGMAQVGIGNVVPDSSAILDLRNTNNRALLLPSIPGTPPSSPAGLVYWDNSLNQILYLESTGYNALSPWRYKYNGAISENTYFNTGGNVGIGNIAPQTKLHLTSNAGMLTLEGVSTAYLSLYPSTFTNGEKARIGFVYNSSQLDIQNLNSGGSVVVHVNNGGDFEVTGGRVRQNNADLIPAGAIIMWSGSSAPAGWVLCDGGGFYNEDGSYMTTPDLRGRFIVGYGSGDYTNPGNRSQGGTSNGSTGGSEKVTLTASNLPSHTHYFTATTSVSGDHRHSMDADGGSTHSSGSRIRREDDYSAQLYTNYAGSHTHSVSGNTDDCGSCSGTQVENRPPYYVLAFIMKK